MAETLKLIIFNNHKRNAETHFTDSHVLISDPTSKEWYYEVVLEDLGDRLEIIMIWSEMLFNKLWLLLQYKLTLTGLKIFH